MEDARGSSGGEIACNANTNAAGAVCKRCVDESGVVIRDDRPTPPAPRTGLPALIEGPLVRLTRARHRHFRRRLATSQSVPGPLRLPVQPSV